MHEPYLTSENHPTKLRKWNMALAPFRKHASSFDITNAALLVIDMQHYFLNEDSHAYVAPGPIVEKKVTKLINKFHEKNRPVIFTYFGIQEGEPDPVGKQWNNPSFEDGTKDCELSPDLPREETDLVLRKNTYSTFHAPEAEKLKKLLKQNNVKNIVICGVFTNLCCETAAREAFDANFNVFILMDGTATKSEELHIASLKNMAYGFATIADTDSLLK